MSRWATELVRLLATETEAQLKEAEANAAQIEARLGLTGDGGVRRRRACPKCGRRKPPTSWRESEFARIKSLLEQRVVSQSEFDQRRTQMEATRQQYEAAKNGAAQQYQSLQAARARVALARKALADTVVRAPFAGVVAERLVSVGDYVTKGMKVAVVVRVNPLRVQLTVPEQFVSAVAVGQPVTFEVDAYPGRQFDGTVRYVSPALQADQRALTDRSGRAEPRRRAEAGPLRDGAHRAADADAGGRWSRQRPCRRRGGTSRVFVVNGDQVEERIVTIGQTVERRSIEITNGLKAGERVATTNVRRSSPTATQGQS